MTQQLFQKATDAKVCRKRDNIEEHVNFPQHILILFKCQMVKKILNSEYLFYENDIRFVCLSQV